MTTTSPTTEPGTVPGGGGIEWIKACESAHCVKVQFMGDEVRIGHGSDSYLSFTRAEWDAFAAGIKTGEFDDLA